MPVHEGEVECSLVVQEAISFDVRYRLTMRCAHLTQPAMRCRSRRYASRAAENRRCWVRNV